MKPSLQLRQTQQLVLTPQLQQSIRLLQMSTLEMDQELEQILRENPLLERIDDPLDGFARIRADGSIDGHDRPAASNDAGPPDAENQDGSTISDRPDEQARIEQTGEWGRGTHRGDDDASFEQIAAAPTTLRDHLREQLAATRCSLRDRTLVELLIDDLDTAGWLESSLSEILAMLPPQAEVDIGELTTALRLLQSFDPAGVGAADLRECLLLQFERNPGVRKADAAVRTASRRLIAQHLNLLAARDYTRLRRVLRCSDDVLREAQELVRTLDPRPGLAFDNDTAGVVVPDVLMRRRGKGWVVALNEDVIPKLQVHQLYAQILGSRRESHATMSNQLQEARWLIKNVRQRFDTILRVAQAIVDRQKAFFTHGAVGMRPLVLREIAETTGLHESTVSRVTTRKYMLTPHGTFELKYFFASHVATDTGGAASSTAIRARIRQFINEEDSKRPLSDNQIVAALAEEGILVARRTVAKYRESMQIPPVSQRKSL